MRPIFFTDMDDVLAVSQQFTSYQVIQAFKLNDLDYPELWDGLVLPEARDNLRALHEEFWPQYVVSSSWSNYMSREQMQEVFRRTGMDFVADNFHKHWTTPKGTGSARVTEIDNWMRKHLQRKQAALVLDDHESGWNLHESHLDKAGLVVLCDPYVGLVREKYLDAQRLLRAQIGPASVA